MKRTWRAELSPQTKKVPSFFVSHSKVLRFKKKNSFQNLVYDSKSLELFPPNHQNCCVMRPLA